MSLKSTLTTLSLDVLDILENSPAESAGLVPYGDWIVGWSGGVLASEGDFYDLVEAVRAHIVPEMCSPDSSNYSMKTNHLGFMFTLSISSELSALVIWALRFKSVQHFERGRACSQ